MGELDCSLYSPHHGAWFRRVTAEHTAPAMSSAAATASL
jgi:hypothetical protein